MGVGGEGENTLLQQKTQTAKQSIRKGLPKGGFPTPYGTQTIGSETQDILLVQQTAMLLFKSKTLFLFTNTKNVLLKTRKLLLFKHRTLVLLKTRTLLLFENRTLFLFKSNTLLFSKHGTLLALTKGPLPVQQ